MIRLVLLGVIALVAFVVIYSDFNVSDIVSLSDKSILSEAATKADVDQSVAFVDQVVEESASPEESKSSDWWVSSGGYFVISNGIAKTNIGALDEADYWRKLYAKNNPRDTDGGYYPQNIFRLVNKKQKKDYVQQMYFQIVKNNESDSEYRNDSNGVLFFNRYVDQNNLYYTGIRVDGYAVIKKKINGKYFTLAYNRIYDGKYDRENKPNLIPTNRWIGLRSEVRNTSEQKVNIRLYIDKESNGNWELVAEADDNGGKYGGAAFNVAGYMGIRTDFMDVLFSGYQN